MNFCFVCNKKVYSNYKYSKGCVIISIDKFDASFCSECSKIIGLDLIRKKFDGIKCNYIYDTIKCVYCKGNINLHIDMYICFYFPEFLVDEIDYNFCKKCTKKILGNYWNERMAMITK